MPVYVAINSVSAEKVRINHTNESKYFETKNTLGQQRLRLDIVNVTVLFPSPL